MSGAHRQRLAAFANDRKRACGGVPALVSSRGVGDVAFPSAPVEKGGEAPEAGPPGSFLIIGSPPALRAGFVALAAPFAGPGSAVKPGPSAVRTGRRVRRRTAGLPQT
ncbi:hypothetical protein FP2506_05831 [Fulvimarina pelagi HTCC2506]|uniref:Uncharacterized protein n=1 Tax=Fulvimarina pelagi HTCC2506 TaxID=314231 RepID=Q0G7N0_9HYPH|nr:hypothetical protein FP2506_05831 [Fulvimarina pelagi HTCC2506]